MKVTDMPDHGKVRLIHPADEPKTRSTAEDGTPLPPYKLDGMVPQGTTYVIDIDELNKPPSYTYDPYTQDPYTYAPGHSHGMSKWWEKGW